MQKVRQELWDMGSSESSKLTYDDIKAMLGGEDGIPHTGMDEKSWKVKSTPTAAGTTARVTTTCVLRGA